MNTSPGVKLNAQISEEAAEWFVEFRTGRPDLKARRQFDVWVRTSPEHLRAYLEVAAIWNDGPALGQEQRYSTAELMRLAGTEGNVVSLGEAAGRGSGAARRAARAPAVNRYAVAAVFLAAFIGVAAWVQHLRANTFSTAVAEQRSVALDDGSTVELNARSRIRVRFADHQRVVELLEGQALFEVAKDSARPFVVRSGGTQVHVLGTRFDVNRRRSGTVVSVVEGRVAISSARTRSDAVDEDASLLGAGEQAVVARGGSIEREARPNVNAATAWMRRQLVFESTPLADIVEEFNRYSPRRFVVDSGAAEQLRLSGVFAATDLDFLVRFLRKRPGVRVLETEGEVRISRHD